MNFKRPPEIYQYLPLFAKLAIERLDADSDLRTAEKLDELIDAYAKTYGEECDDYIRASAHFRCSKRFGDTFKGKVEPEYSVN